MIEMKDETDPYKTPQESSEEDDEVQNPRSLQSTVKMGENV